MGVFKFQDAIKELKRMHCIKGSYFIIPLMNMVSMMPYNQEVEDSQNVWKYEELHIYYSLSSFLSQFIKHITCNLNSFISVVSLHIKPEIIFWNYSNC